MESYPISELIELYNLETNVHDEYWISLFDGMKRDYGRAIIRRAQCVGWTDNRLDYDESAPLYDLVEAALTYIDSMW
jgi:hypothetical protein